MCLGCLLIYTFFTSIFIYTNASSSCLNWETGLALGSVGGKFAAGDRKARCPSGRTGPQRVEMGLSQWLLFLKFYRYRCLFFLSTDGNCVFKQNIQTPISFPSLIRKLKGWLFLQSCGFLTLWCFSFFPAQYPHEVNGTPMYLYEVATESVCESAARLLFMSIKWAKSVPAFSTLSLQDQV